jgi:hypothetical protein
VAKAYPFRGRAIYRLVGRVVEEFGFYSMEVDEMYKEDLLADPRYDEPHKQIANKAPPSLPKGEESARKSS